MRRPNRLFVSAAIAVVATANALWRLASLDGLRGTSSSWTAAAADAASENPGDPSDNLQDAATATVVRDECDVGNTCSRWTDPHAADGPLGRRRPHNGAPNRVCPLVPNVLKTDGAPDAYYMLPTSSLPGTQSIVEPASILFFFHGCKHSGADFFLLPEDRVVAHAALQRNIAIVSFSASHPSGCWQKRDVRLVQKQIRQFSAVTGLQIRGKGQGGFDRIRVDEDYSNSNSNSKDIPLICMGMSMGVTAAYLMEQLYDFASMALYTTYHYIDDVRRNRRGSSGHGRYAVRPYPPSIWIHMPRDVNTHDNMGYNFARLQDTGSKYREIEIHPKPFTQQRCQRYLPELGIVGCRQLIRQFVADGFVDGDDGTVTRCPDRSLIQPVLANMGLGSVESFVAARGITDNACLDLHLQHARYYRNAGETAVCDDNDERDTQDVIDCRLQRQQQQQQQQPVVNVSSWPRTSFLGRTWLWAGVEQEIAYCYARHEMVSDHADEVLDYLTDALIARSVGR